MMKKGLMAAAALLVLLLLCACGKGNADHVYLNLEESSRYTHSEIMEGVDAVRHTFEKGFRGCTLTALTYDEERSLRESGQAGKDVMVLLSTFETGPTGGDGSLNPNDTYTRYQWFLARNSKGNWEVTDWGYG